MRFRSFVPHMITQAPAATCILYDILYRFVQDWSAHMQRVPLGLLNVEDRRGADDILTSPDESDGRAERAKDGRVKEEQTARRVRGELLTRIDGYAQQIAAVMGEAVMHGALVATVLGAVLCAVYILPHSRRVQNRVPAAATTGNSATQSNRSGESNTNSNSSNSSRVTASNTTTTVALSRRPTLSTVMRGNRNSGNNSSSVSQINKASMSDLVTMNATSVPEMSRGGAETTTTMMSLSDGTATDVSLVERLEAASWLYEPHRVTEGEWQLRQFAPLGVLLRRSGATSVELLRDHLCCFASQLCIGFSHAHRVEGRRKFAQCALLTGLCDCRAAWVMYHFASEANASTSVFNWSGVSTTAMDHSSSSSSSAVTTASAGAVTLPSVTLAAFTRAVERYTAGAESELVLNVSSAPSPAPAPPPPSFDQSMTASGVPHMERGYPVYGMNMNSLHGSGNLTTIMPSPAGMNNNSTPMYNHNSTNNNITNNNNNNNMNVSFRGGGTAAGVGRDMYANRAMNQSNESREAVHHGLGELTGERFCRMVFPHPLPVWDSFVSNVATVMTHLSPTAASASSPAGGVAMSSVSSLATRAKAPAGAVKTILPAASASSAAAAQIIAAAVAPGRFVLELLVAGYHWAAVQAMQSLMLYDHANVLLIPRRSMDGFQGVSVAVYVRAVLMRWLQRWREMESGQPDSPVCDTTSKEESIPRQEVSCASLPCAAWDAEVERVMGELLPLLSWVNTHAASQTVVCALLHRLHRWCERQAATVHCGGGAASDLCPAPVYVVALRWWSRFSFDLSCPACVCCRPVTSAMISCMVSSASGSGVRLALVLVRCRCCTCAIGAIICSTAPSRLVAMRTPPHTAALLLHQIPTHLSMSARRIVWVERNERSSVCRCANTACAPRTTWCGARSCTHCFCSPSSVSTPREWGSIAICCATSSLPIPSLSLSDFSFRRWAMKTAFCTCTHSSCAACLPPC